MENELPGYCEDELSQCTERCSGYFSLECQNQSKECPGCKWMSSGEHLTTTTTKNNIKKPKLL